MKHHSLKKILLLPLILLFPFSVSIGQCIGGDCTNGWGTYVWSTGGEYTGQWLNSDRTGLGCYDWDDGSFYYGYFLLGKLEGDGIFLGTDESKDLFGRFHDGALAESKSFSSSGCILGDCMNGAGVYLWESNDMFIGQWVEGNRTGYGRYDWADGSFYTGYFKEGKLDGQGTYIGADRNKMEGLFVDGVFQESTARSEPYPSNAAYTGVVKETDLCSMIQAAIKDYPNNFESLKGQKHPEEGLSLGDIWDANMKVSGAASSNVSEGFPGAHNTWYSVLFEGPEYTAARAKYDEIVSKMGGCTKGVCCTFVTDKNDYTSENYKSYLSYWMTFLVNDGYSEVYQEMVIECELSTQVVDKGWQIVARVKEFK